MLQVEQPFIDTLSRCTGVIKIVFIVISNICQVIIKDVTGGKRVKYIGL